MFDIFRDYTRLQIYETLGGSRQSYLPTADGRVLCACLRSDINPKAPNIVVVGRGKGIEHEGDVLASQREPIPVFVKRASNAWTYHGLFRVHGSSQRAADIRLHAPTESRSEITRVIFLQPAERAIESLSSSCIYTIRRSGDLAAAYSSGGGGEFTERGRWIAGSRILQEARKSQQRVPILFAPSNSDSSSCGVIIYWALIDDIALTPQGTKVKFSALQPFSKKHRPSSLKKLSNGERLADNYIWPYVPCKTPAFLFSLEASTASAEFMPDIEADEISVREGAVSTRQHLHRERDPKIVATKRRQVLAATKRLACSACGFDFGKFYGELGAEFCEVHHLRSLADADGEIETRLDDLAVVCSNCHRMIHRSHPFLTIDQLRSKIRDASIASRHDPRKGRDAGSKGR
jgi:hypothetical protein